MGLIQITPPAVVPLSLAEAKAHARIDGAEDDALVAGYIRSATASIEAYLGMALITSSWRCHSPTSPVRGPGDPGPPRPGAGRDRDHATSILLVWSRYSTLRSTWSPASATLHGSAWPKARPGLPPDGMMRR